MDVKIKFPGNCAVNEQLNLRLQDAEEKFKPSRITVRSNPFHVLRPAATVGIRAGCFVGTMVGWTIGIGTILNPKRRRRPVAPATLFIHEGPLIGACCGISLGAWYGAGLSVNLGYHWPWSWSLVQPLQRGVVRLLASDKVGQDDMNGMDDSAAGKSGQLWLSTTRAGISRLPQTILSWFASSIARVIVRRPVPRFLRR